MKKQYFTLETVNLPGETTGHPLTYFWRFTLYEGKREVFHSYFKASWNAIWLVFSDIHTKFMCDGIMRHESWCVHESAVPGVLGAMFDSPEEFMSQVLQP